MFYLIEKINSVSLQSTNGTDTIITKLDTKFEFNLEKTENEYKTSFENLFTNLSNNENFETLINSTINTSLPKPSVIFDPVEFYIQSTQAETEFIMTASESLRQLSLGISTKPEGITIFSLAEKNDGRYRFKAETNNFNTESYTFRINYVTQSLALGTVQITMKLQS